MDFNRINPICDDQGQRQPDEQNNRNESVFQWNRFFFLDISFISIGFFVHFESFDFFLYFLLHLRLTITTFATRGNSVVKQSSTYLSKELCSILNRWFAISSVFIEFSHIEITICFIYTGITSGRGYAHGEVGIAYLDIESVCITAWHTEFRFVCIDFIHVLYSLHFPTQFIFVFILFGRLASGKIDSVKRWPLVFRTFDEN